MKHTFFMLVAITLIESGCSTYTKVYSDYDHSTNFTTYKTFAWLPDKADTINTPYNNEIIRNNIKNYFGQCMSDRGYSFDAENPDVLMELVIINAKREKALPSYSSIYYYKPYYYGSYYYHPYPFAYYYRYYPSYAYSSVIGYPNTQKVENIKGSITLNFIDRKSKKLIWTGTAEGDIYDPAVIEKDLHPAVHSILEKYPVRPLVVRSHKIR